MKESIQAITSSCSICLERKDKGSIKFSKKSLSTEHCFEKVFLDIAGPFAFSENRSRYLLVMVDGFSKWPVLAALRNISSYEVCKAIFQKWISVFGSPQNFHSDNGLCFSSSEMAKFCNYFGVKQHFSSPYYPMGNAIVERLIKNVKDALYCTCKEKACDWEEAIPTVEITLPKLTNKSLGLSPYEAVYGR